MRWKTVFPAKTLMSICLIENKIEASSTGIKQEQVKMEMPGGATRQDIGPDDRQCQLG